ncbi:LOW QUALITY PROTEIN: protein trichome birefringence-like protein 14 [Cinnamomum micranthum f. kanehirae]|uniref:Protein trichome birefringence-like protein 14 n=1 Tax=Cinnamomum micranthum f. kanehirae TaxID=337451 RepID=A0A443P2E9_9MAGN|nr:LOW QUALITY PROTEIN: protein trichome birefringence-like protein 14 [Cinnamomum micranthum f. kanehirae]
MTLNRLRTLYIRWRGWSRYGVSTVWSFGRNGGYRVADSRRPRTVQDLSGEGTGVPADEVYGLIHTVEAPVAGHRVQEKMSLTLFMKYGLRTANIPSIGSPKMKSPTAPHVEANGFLAKQCKLIKARQDLKILIAGYNGLRGKRLSLTLTALICTTILLWQWEKTPLFTVLSPQNQLEILSPVVVDAVQTLDHETANEEDVKIKAVEKETKDEQGERNTEEHLNEPTVETINDDAKNSGALPTGFETARSPEREMMVYESFKQGVTMPRANGLQTADDHYILVLIWLSRPWSCRLSQRTDFSYEGFRWQPENCEMPDFDGFTMQHRTVALVGNSLGRQQF